jgi:hypothetical protein
MPRSTAGMAASSLGVAAWRKSTHSNPHGDCVELAELEGGKIAVRNSRNPGGPALIFARTEIAAFIQAAAENDLSRLPGISPQRSQFRGSSINHAGN